MKKWTALLIVCGLPVAGFAQNWPEFRGIDRAGVADGQRLPIRWSIETRENIAFATPVAGLAHSSPIVSGEHLYLTVSEPVGRAGVLEVGRVSGGKLASDETVPQRFKLLALSKSSGETLWETVAFEGIPRVKRHIKNSYASATPATNGTHVFALFGSEGLYCFDAGGGLRWKRDLGVMDAGYATSPELQWGPASSPILHGDLVIVQDLQNGPSSISAFDVATGEPAWKVNLEELPGWSTPLLYRGDRVEMIINSGRFIYGLDPGDGRELWRLNNQATEVLIPSPVAWKDRVIVTGGAPRGNRPIYAIKPGGAGDITPAEGEETSSRFLWQLPRGSPYTPTPIVYRDIVYTCADNGVLRAYDVRTGELHYEVRIGGGAGFSASPVASDGRIFFASEDGNVYVVKAGTAYELLAANDMGEVLMASPAISDETLFVRGRSHLFAIRDVEGSGSEKPLPNHTPERGSVPSDLIPLSEHSDDRGPGAGRAVAENHVTDS